MEAYQPFDAELLPLLERVRDIVKEGRHHNGWITMILCKGIENTNSDLANVLNSVSVISGLFITVSLSAVMSPPDGIKSLEKDDWIKQTYLAMIILSTAGFLFSIVMNTIFMLNLNTTARVSDMLKLYLTLGRVPLITIILFSVGTQSLLLALALTTFTEFGLAPAISYCVILTGGNMLFFYLNNGWILKISHVVQYWAKKSPEDYKTKVLKMLDEFQMKIFDDEILKKRQKKDD